MVFPVKPMVTRLNLRSGAVARDSDALPQSAKGLIRWGPAPFRLVIAAHYSSDRANLFGDEKDNKLCSYRYSLKYGGPARYCANGYALSNTLEDPELVRTRNDGWQSAQMME